MSQAREGGARAEAIAVGELGRDAFFGWLLKDFLMV